MVPRKLLKVTHESTLVLTAGEARGRVPCKWHPSPLRGQGTYGTEQPADGTSKTLKQGDRSQERGRDLPRADGTAGSAGFATCGEDAAADGSVQTQLTQHTTRQDSANFTTRQRNPEPPDGGWLWVGTPLRPRTGLKEEAPVQMPKPARGGVGGLVGRVHLRPPPPEKETTLHSWCHLPVTNQAASIFCVLFANTHSGSRFQPLTGACTIRKQQFCFRHNGRHYLIPTGVTIMHKGKIQLITLRCSNANAERPHTDTPTAPSHYPQVRVHPPGART